MYTDEFPKMLEEFKPATTVPSLLIEGQDQAIWDSFAIAETLHERHPDAGVWPKDAALRAMARSLTAEMHSGFGALRDECTMNLEYSYLDFPVSDAVKANLARLEKIWAIALEQSGGPWLCGIRCVLTPRNQSLRILWQRLTGRSSGFAISSAVTNRLRMPKPGRNWLPS